jgi:hypothetical protein
MICLRRLLIVASALALGPVAASACSSSTPKSPADAAGGNAGANPGEAGAGGKADASDVAGGDARDAGVNCSCGRGAYVPTCGVDGKTYDAACGLACVPVKIACSGQCPCAAGAPRPCQFNSDCDAGQVCYVGFAPTCASSNGGTCVTRRADTCPQSLGSGCPCVDVSAGSCNQNAGGFCHGTDDANACWACQLPV